MKIPILIEQTADQSFRATGGEPFAQSVEAGTPEEAIQKFQECVDTKVAQGAKIVSLELPDEMNPWLDGAGMFQNDPLFDEWQKTISEQRAEGNKDTEAP
jgi:hypothetical protein